MSDVWTAIAKAQGRRCSVTCSENRKCNTAGWGGERARRCSPPRHPSNVCRHQLQRLGPSPARPRVCLQCCATVGTRDCLECSHLDEQRGLREVQVRLAAIERNRHRLQLVQVVLKLLRDINVPILRNIPASVTQGTNGKSGAASRSASRARHPASSTSDSYDRTALSIALLRRQVLHARTGSGVRAAMPLPTACSTHRMGCSRCLNRDSRCFSATATGLLMPFKMPVNGQIGSCWVEGEGTAGTPQHLCCLFGRWR